MKELHRCLAPQSWLRRTGSYRQRQARPRRVLETVLPIIHEIFEADQKAPKNQRHTRRRILERLKADLLKVTGLVPGRLAV
jgi:hypothetical protein